MSTALEAGKADPEPTDPAIGADESVPLTSLRSGDRGRLHTTRLVVDDREVLHALGLAERCRFRVCKAGDPWILQVRGTRVGMSAIVAGRILVIPEPRRER
ncbi:MAG: ferrous iron transport protein A [bacterium]|nr:ferrous iron transport protein A [bacterium]